MRSNCRSLSAEGCRTPYHTPTGLPPPNSEQGDCADWLKEPHPEKEKSPNLSVQPILLSAGRAIAALEADGRALRPSKGNGFLPRNFVLCEEVERHPAVEPVRMPEINTARTHGWCRARQSRMVFCAPCARLLRFYVLCEAIAGALLWRPGARRRATRAICLSISTWRESKTCKTKVKRSGGTLSGGYPPL